MKSTPLDQLRRNAQEALIKKSDYSANNTNELQHELNVCEIALQMQNEELLKTNNALEEALDRYINLYEYAPVAYITLTLEGLISEANQTAVNLLTVEHRYLLNHRFSVLLSPKDLDRWQILFRRLTQHKKEEISFEITLNPNQNRFIHIQANCVVVTIDNKAPVIRMALTDITENSERNQRELDLRISAVAFESNQAMIITDSESFVLRANKAYATMFGYKQEDIIGKNTRVLKSGHHTASFYRELWDSLLCTGAWMGEIWNRRENGEQFLCWLSITAITETDEEVTHYVASYIDITEQKTAEAEIKNLAFYDPLTQLPNRRLLFERLKSSIEMARRNNKQLALLMLDLDYFKTINDSLGHAAGDEVLKQVASRMTNRLRDADFIARLGGDEFIILLENLAHSQDAGQVSKEIIADLSLPFHINQSDEVLIGASIGISLYPQHANNPELLMDHADSALYQAKDQGRGRLAYFSKELTTASEKRNALELKLTRAIEQQQLLVYYQPQIDIISGRIIGAEALVHWQDPDQGLILPCNFIPIAEETRLIMEIDEWVMLTSCRQGKLWIDKGLPAISMAINISSQHFRRSDIIAMVTNVLSGTDFPAEKLKLEITECGLMKFQDDVIGIINDLNTKGIQLAIDDFGTGYSSLARLKHFPIDVLKIDKSFIDNIPQRKTDMEIAAAIVAMGHCLGFKVMAEGVEKDEQLDFLKKIGCDSYQGYLKSYPLPANEFTRLLRDEQTRGKAF